MLVGAGITLSKPLAVSGERQMQIHGSLHVHGPQAIHPPHHSARVGQAAAAQPRSLAQVDQVDISPEASFVAQTRELPSIRQERVAAIRAQIEAGVYETEDKLQRAVDALLDELV